MASSNSNKIDNQLTIRCPYCLHNRQVAKNISTTENLRCERCKQFFLFQNALPSKQETTVSQTSVVVKKTSHSSDILKLWMLGIPSLLISFLYVRSLGKPMDGPDFIILYLFLFVIVWLLIIFLRRNWWDTLYLPVFGFILIEAIGVDRYIYGTQLGMHKFSVLFIMMAIGGILIFISMSSSRSRHGSGDGGCGGFFGGGDSGGGCGSSCGGGGCGGCGG